MANQPFLAGVDFDCLLLELCICKGQGWVGAVQGSSLLVFFHCTLYIQGPGVGRGSAGVEFACFLIELCIYRGQGWVGAVQGSISFAF